MPPPRRLSRISASPMSITGKHRKVASQATAKKPSRISRPISDNRDENVNDSFCSLNDE